MTVHEEINAAKNTITGDQVWDLVAQADKIVVASGKKVLEFAPATDDKEDIVAKISGRTGNLRAPALRLGNTYYIGFNEAMYQQLGAKK